jgi:hypothetical protein
MSMLIISKNGETLKNYEPSEGRTSGIESRNIKSKVPTGLVPQLSEKKGEV